MATPASAIARQALRDSRVRLVTFAWFFAAIAFIQPVAYRNAYPTQLDRLRFATSFGDQASIRLFYGKPHDLLTVAGYSAWRVGGTVALLAAAWGLLAAVRALRTEEEAGRADLILAGIVGRRAAFLAALAAIGAGAAILVVAMSIALVAGGLPLGGSLYLTLAALSPIGVFVGIGALVSQLAPTRRLALTLGYTVFAVAFAMRVVADTSASADWLRWITPLGWAEELRPFAGARPLVLLLPVATTVVLLVGAGRLAVRRDVGAGLLPERDSAAPRTTLLSSTIAQALRGERTGLIGWLVGVGAFAFILGVIADSISAAGASESLRRQVAKLGGDSVFTPSGYLGFSFLFFVLAVSLFCCSQVAATRHEEAGGQLETLLALPVTRGRWLGGRLALACMGAVVLALAAGVLAWAGARSQGVAVSFPRMLEAGANCLPAALLFGGLGALAFAVVPRASTGIAYGLVGAMFLWQLFGALLGAPQWLLDLSPFEHVGLVPAQPLRAEAAIAMLVIAAGAAGAALWAFRRRDLAGA